MKLVQRLLWLLDYLNVVGANRGACFFQEGTRPNERIPHTLQHPCNGSKEVGWKEGGGQKCERKKEGLRKKRKQTAHGGLLWAKCVCFEPSQDIMSLQEAFRRHLSLHNTDAAKTTRFHKSDWEW